ncbi:MAG: chromosomal replication initiator protein DnaA [Bacilli bacterium]|nr:chromosomal replication initiator protein DnaA [Bacilli bacterium]
MVDNNDQIVYDTFFAGSYIDSINGNAMNVAVNSRIAAQVLSSKYKDSVDAIVNEVTQSNYEIVFIAEEDLTKNDFSSQQKPAKPIFFADSKVNKNYTFQNFIVGPSNREAYQAAIMCSRAPGKMYNPILIYGDSGLGKTHLLNAIGNAVNERFPTLRVLYVTAQDFFNEYVKFVQGDKEGNNIVDWFKNSVDILLIDDVQFLVNKQKTEETFFAVYNSFYSSGKQVVITADQHPSKLNGLDERLKSRFVQGLPLSIHQPEKETCEQILKLRIEAAGLDVENFDPEVISYFAEKFRKNIRELEGALDRLLFYIVNIKPSKHVDLDTAMSSVQSLIDVQEDKTRLSEEKIINVVADYYNLASYQLTGRIRTSQIALARHIAMYLIRTMLDVPFTKIGKIFGGKDHATVMNGVNKVENQLKIDKNLEKAISDIRGRLEK